MILFGEFMTHIRLNHNANTLQEVEIYYRERAIQMLYENYYWDSKIIPFEDLGAYTFFSKDYSKPMVSFYVFENKRGQGAFNKFIEEWWIKNKWFNFVTAEDCNLEEYFKTKNIPYLLTNKFQQNSAAYNLITKVYGNTSSIRSKTPYMNHIDEGIAIMKHYNFSESSINAFCLHPIFQVDDLFATHGKDIIGDQNKYNLNPKDIMLALEYRNIANAYLSFRKINSIKEISLSPLEEVNQMLIADKIQN